MDAKNHVTEIREMGAKLANFRKKLALAIGQKKITQLQFGEMYGGYTSREINSYETGNVPLPGLLLYLIWEKGNSVDDIFNEGTIDVEGAERARLLYQECSFVGMKKLNQMEIARTIKEVKERGGDSQTEGTQKTTLKTSGKRKTSRGETRTTTKR